MPKKKQDKKISDYDEREMAFKSLPPSIRNLMTDEEKELFLHAEEWPDSMFEKLSEFIVKRDDE